MILHSSSVYLFSSGEDGDQAIYSPNGDSCTVPVMIYTA